MNDSKMDTQRVWRDGFNQGIESQQGLLKGFTILSGGLLLTVIALIGLIIWGGTCG